MGSRDVSLDIMRILACLAVITVHTAGTGLLPGRDYPLLSFEWITCFVMNALSGWAVPLFVMITGSIFLDSQKDVVIVKLFKNNILKLLVILIVWSAFYTYFCNGTFFPLGMASGHLWYLSMIVALYLTIPVIRNLPNKIRDYFLIVWFAFLIYDFSTKLYHINVLREFEHNFFTGYVGYLILGDWCRRMKDNKKLCFVIIMIALLLYVLAICISIYMSSSHGKITSPLINYFSPIIVLVSVAVYYVSNMLSNYLTGMDKLKTIIRNLSASTLGIYLIHIFLLTQGYTRVVRYIHNPLLFIPLIVFLVFVSGFLITIVLRKIPILGKYIV